MKDEAYGSGSVDGPIMSVILSLRSFFLIAAARRPSSPSKPSRPTKPPTEMPTIAPVLMVCSALLSSGRADAVWTAELGVDSAKGSRDEELDKKESGRPVLDVELSVEEELDNREVLVTVTTEPEEVE